MTELVKTFPAFYGKLIFITEFTKTCKSVPYLTVYNVMIFHGEAMFPPPLDFQAGGLLAVICPLLPSLPFATEGLTVPR
jgi:hypothetical protein